MNRSTGSASRPKSGEVSSFPRPTRISTIGAASPASSALHSLRRWMLGGLVAIDFLAATVTVIVTASLLGLQLEQVNAAFISAPIVLVFLMIKRMYDWNKLFWGASEFGGILAAVSESLIAILAAGYFLNNAVLVSPAWLLTYGLVILALVSGGRRLFRSAVKLLQVRGTLVNRTLIVGDNTEAQLLLKRLKRGAGLKPVGYVGRDALPREQLTGLPYLGSIAHIESILERGEVDAVLVAASSLTYLQVKDVMRATRGHVTDVHIAAGLYEIIPDRVLVKEIAGMPMTTVRPMTFGLGSAIIKRTFDVIVSCAVLVVISPLLIVIPILIAATSKGGVFFRQERIGKNGQIIHMLKFRSMLSGSDGAIHEEFAKAQAHIRRDREDDDTQPSMHKPVNDPRITWIGRWLRKYSLDELPQIFNVLKGEMSLVGPRPAIDYEVDLWDDWMAKRLQVTPGISGLWQVSGRSELSHFEMIKLDLFYIENWSLLLDLNILLRTIPTVLSSRGAG